MYSSSLVISGRSATGRHAAATTGRAFGEAADGQVPGPDSLQGVSTRDTDWEGVRLHVVTGKGGTGKTTVAGALAIALASGGGKVLLIEMEGRQGIARLFDGPPLPYQERRGAGGARHPTPPTGGRGGAAPGGA